MNYIEIINSINHIENSKYQNITSNERLALFAVDFLVKNSVPLTFSYICIATFKFFPDKFYFDNEFKEFPHIEKLNRTILHMVTNKTQQYLVGDVRKGYQLTKIGEIVSEQVKQDILSSSDEKAKHNSVMDSYKKGTVQDYNKIKLSRAYLRFSSDRIADLDEIWKFFDVIPYTQINRIVKSLIVTQKYSKSINDNECAKYIAEVVDLIKSNK